MRRPLAASSRKQVRQLLPAPHPPGPSRVGKAGGSERSKPPMASVHTPRVRVQTSTAFPVMSCRPRPTKTPLTLLLGSPIWVLPPTEILPYWTLREAQRSLALRLASDT
jgi:hypothetical protein